MAEFYQHNLEHLEDELAWLDLNLRLGVLRARSGPRGAGEFYVTDQKVSDLLNGGGGLVEHPAEETGMRELIAEKRQAIAARLATSREAGVFLRLPRLQALFSLAPFEVDVLVICLAPELDLKYEHLYAYLHDDATRRAPRVDLILNLLCLSPEERAIARGAFLDSGRLLRYGLLRWAEPAEAARPLLGRALKLDEGIANYLLGGNEVDPRIAVGAYLIPPPQESQSQTESLPLLPPFRRYLESSSTRQWIALFHGLDRGRQEETARRLCAETGTALLRVDLEALVGAEQPFEQLITLVFRDAALKLAAVYAEPLEVFSEDQEGGTGRCRSLEKALADLGWVTFLAGGQPVALNDHLKRQHFFVSEFPLPSYPVRRKLWHEFVGNGYPLDDDLPLEELAARYRFTRREINNALGLARTQALLRDGPEGVVTLADLMAACRAESNPGLAKFARKVVSSYAWDDLILPLEQQTQLKEIVAYIRNHEAVYSEWGFGGKHSLGKGINLLLSGPSGTGKTMTAGIMARELGLDCYKIDLAAVVSKYIGETEKNLHKIFQEAENSNAILFFDEADALFGKRSEVRDSHDRYANIEINYLLQKMEEHEGVVILATNQSKNMDDAFLRRLHFSVVFPSPELEQRLQVWQRVFPAATPQDPDIDWEFLARRFKIVGGNIKNIAVGAALLARNDQSAVSMRHLILAAKREFQKMGKLCTKAEFGEYYELVS